MGYHRAGFDVTGVDIAPQPRYPFAFAQADALEFLREFGHEFDFIHASPPCQGYSHLTPAANRGDHAKLIPAVRDLLESVGKPWVIENAQGARHELRNPVMLCGSMFGLRTRRHRWFECSFTLTAPGPCDHREMPLLVTTASKASRAKRHALGMKPKTVANAPAAYGVDWMTCDGLKECIPPAYTEWIGREFLNTANHKLSDRPDRAGGAQGGLAMNPNRGTESDVAVRCSAIVRRPSHVGWYAVEMKGGYKTQAWWSQRLQMWQLRDGGYYPPDDIANWQQC